MERRVDQAAVAAVNANLSIDALDWSDRVVHAGVPWEFSDEDRVREHPEETQVARPTTSGNNKHYAE